MNRTRGILLALLGIGVIVVGVVFVASLVRPMAIAAPQPTPRPPLTVPVVVVTHDVPLNVALQASDLGLVDMPIELAPKGALTDINAGVGMVTKVQLVGGEMLMQHHLADPTNTTRDYAFTIRNDQVLMAFPTTDLMSQIKILQPGDQVDILVSVEESVRPESASDSAVSDAEDAEPEDELFTFSALQRTSISAVVVEVTQRQSSSSSSSRASTGLAAAGATPQPTPTPEPEDIKPQAILLALAPQDALVLKHLKDAGGVFDIVLRSPTSTQRFELSPVSAEYVKDQYQLVITR